MLVSSGIVRHTSRIAGFRDAIRFADREHLADYHPAFAVNPATDGEDDPDDAARTRVAAALSAIVELFASTGWDAVLVADCVEHVAYRLADLTSRANAGTPTGEGVLQRLLNEDPLDSLRCDTGLLAALWAAKPNKSDAS